MAKMTPKEAKRQQRHRKIRAKVSGTASRPRISVYRSNQHVYVQVIDDENQSTIAALGTMSKSVKAVIGEEEWKGKTVESAEQVGKCSVKCASTRVSRRPSSTAADFSTTGASRRSPRARAPPASPCRLVVPLHRRTRRYTHVSKK